MSAAIVQVCVDPRLSHELLRVQVRQRLERQGLRPDDVFIVNDAGGNVGAGFAGTLDLLVRTRRPVVLCAVLHHDDCRAEQAGLRRPIGQSRDAIASLLAERRLVCPILTGSVLTETNELRWSDEAPRSAEVLSFRMPRMYGR